MKRDNEGLTLIELIMASVLLCVVFFTAATLMINFRRFFSNYTESASSAAEASAALEAIANKIAVSNSVATPSASQIIIYIDNLTGTGSPHDPTDDTAHTFTWDNANSRLLYKVGNGANNPIADHVRNLSFTLTHPAVGGSVLNAVKVVLVSDATGKNETMETTVIARGRSGI